MASIIINNSKTDESQTNKLNKEENKDPKSDDSTSACLMTCEVCDYECRNKDTLKKHMNNKHHY